MERMCAPKSRREKRKEARKEKKQRKNESWLAHQKGQKVKRAQHQRKFKDSMPNNANRSKNKFIQNFSEREGRQQDTNFRRNQSSEKMDVGMTMEVKTKSLSNNHSSSSATVKERKGLKRKSKTKFEEFLEMDMKNADTLAQEDLKLERKLAKELKVKDGKLRGMDDEINFLLDGIPCLDDSFDDVIDDEGFPNGRLENGISDKKPKKKKSLDESLEDDIAVNFMGGVPEPVKTSNAEMGQEKCAELGQGEGTAKKTSRKRRRRSKKSTETEDCLLGDTSYSASKPTEFPLQETPSDAPAVASSVKYVAPHLRSRAANEPEEHTQIRRRVRGLLNRLSESNVESVTGEMATIFRSVSRSVGSQIISDEVLAACSGGPRGNEQYAAVFASFVAGMACSVGMDFSAKLMAGLARSFEDEYLKEDNLSLRNLTLLLSYLCIFGVCSSDLIYDFLIMLSKRLEEIDVSTILTLLQCCGMKIRGDDPTAMKNFIESVQSRVNEIKTSIEGDQAKIIGKRMEFMLETICDIKNNKKRPKEDTAQHTRIKKWLQKLGVGEILIRGLKWSKLLDPDKKGQWWLSGDITSKPDDVEEVANTIDKEVLEAQKMLQLAASQRMNTDARKAIFCIIMSGEDYLDAFEKLLRLYLPGQQDREIMRVLVECCLQEKVFNKYYTVLASKLCKHDRNHKTTLRFCIWDHFKQLESMELLRSMHLAKFVAEMVASGTLSLSILKSDLSDAGQLTSKRIMHFRILFEAIFEYPDKDVWNMFTCIAKEPELESLRHGIEFFIREYVIKTNNAAANKFKVAKKALNSMEGFLI
ncbi:nucleolar MIF4G domain-containing protein 1 isoform X1 [Jatropha curcas]|nr:nucleolar MIF4G domain-containing protein 1 isoform X1 [Jatropha curcas]